jgi:hypothetical protein
MKYIKNKYRLILAVVLAVSFMGCSSLSGPLFKPAAEIPTDKSIIYLYRPNDDRNTEFTIEYNNMEICVLENGGYFPFFVEEGKVEISSSVNFKMFATGLLDIAVAGTTEFYLQAEPGKSYYIQCQAIESGGNKLFIKSVPENFGINDIKECRLLEPISQ